MQQLVRGLCSPPHGLKGRVRWLQQRIEGDIAEHGCMKDQDLAKEHTVYLQGFFFSSGHTLPSRITEW